MGYELDLLDDIDELKKDIITLYRELNKEDYAQNWQVIESINKKYALDNMIINGIGFQEGIHHG